MGIIESFTDTDGQDIRERFARDGFVVLPGENPEGLAAIRAVAADVARRETDIDPGLSDDQILNHVHKHVGIAELNGLRLATIQALRSKDWFRPTYFSLARQAIFEIVGNELAMQRSVGLSVQLPQDTSSLLPIHSDVWDGDSAFEAVLWVPLVSCFETKSMYLFAMERDRERQKEVAAHQRSGPEALYESIKDDAVFVNVPYGSVLLFSQTLMHGNRVNEKDETRWSMNCRFKSLMSPYADKRLGEFFEPIVTRPATRIGLEYKMPEGFVE